jgi:hypothetical protein
MAKTASDEVFEEALDKARHFETAIAETAAEGILGLAVKMFFLYRNSFTSTRGRSRGGTPPPARTFSRGRLMTIGKAKRVSVARKTQSDRRKTGSGMPDPMAAASGVVGTARALVAAETGRVGFFPAVFLPFSNRSCFSTDGHLSGCPRDSAVIRGRDA